MRGVLAYMIVKVGFCPKLVAWMMNCVFRGSICPFWWIEDLHRDI